MNKNTDNSRNELLTRVIKAINPVLMSGAFYCAWKLYYSSRTAVQYWWKGEVVIVGLFFITYLYLSHLYHGYWIHINRISEIVYSQFLAASITMVLMYLVMMLICKKLPSIIPLILMLLAQLLIIGSWALCAHRWYYRTHPKRKTVIIWDERPNLEQRIEDYGMTKQFEIIGISHINECRNYYEEILKDAEIIFMSDLHSHDRNQLIKYCIATDKAAYVIPRIGDAIMAGADSTHLMHLPIMLVQGEHLTWEYLIIKRIFDILMSAAALILLSPLIIATAIAIKLCDGGDVFYRQERLTKDGACFQIIKFRSMKMDAEADGIAVLSTGINDDRITPVGRVIRMLRIDELPQLINVLRGDMSLVGPRPERPDIAAEYEKELPEFSLRLQMKAGVTGYAQVYGQYNTKPYDKLLLDLMYISKASITEDLRIILATLKILFMAESTEGVDEKE